METKENFKLYSQYYDLLYHDKTYIEEVEYVTRIILDKKPEAENMLELGCGSGSHAKYFSEKGFHITGIDRSNEMIEKALNKDIPNFEPLVGDIADFKLDNRFDVVISLFHVISYLTKNTELISGFKNVNRHLNRGGLFLFDCWFTPAVYHLKPENRTKYFENDSMKIRRDATSIMSIEQNTVEVCFDVTIEDKETKETDKLQENHLMRHFSIPEIQLISSFAGFKMIQCEEIITKNKPGLDTWAVCFTLQKITDI